MHSHGRSQGVPVYTRGRVEKNFFGRGNLQGKLKVQPPGRAKNLNFCKHFCWVGEIWKVGVVNLANLACVFEVTTKKGKLFRGEVHLLPRENPGYA